MQRDTQFLAQHNIVDYSMLIGLQRDVAQSHKNSIVSISDPARRHKKLNTSEREAIWSSLVKLVEEPPESQNDRLGLESRMSNVSALIELLGDGSPQTSPSKSSLNASGRSFTVLKKYLTPRKKSLGLGAMSSSSTPTDSFQVHHPLAAMSQQSLESIDVNGSVPSKEQKRPIRKFFSSILRPSSRIFPVEDQNTVINDRTIEDLHHIEEVRENIFSLDSWQEAVGVLESRDSNRRNLPDEINGVHIIDGFGSVRYYCGIIDIFTQYGWRQRIAQMLKNIR